MANSRTKNSIRNTFFGIINRCTNLLIPFILRSIIIQKLGYEYLGLNSLFISIIHVLNLSELGVGSALIFRMYKPVAENNFDEISSLLFLYKKIYRIIGLFVLVLGLIILPLLPFLVDLNQLKNTGINVYVLFLIYLINTVISYLFFAYKKSILTAYQQNFLISLIDCVVHTIMYVVQIIVLLVIPNYYLYIVLMPIFTFIDNIFVAIISNKKFPQLKNPKQLNNIGIRTILNDMKYIFGHKIGAVVLSSSDSIIISAFLDLAILTKYGNYHYIITALTGFLNVGYTAVLSSIGNSIVKDSKEKILKLYYELSFCVFCFVAFCSCCLLSLYQPFMQLWMGETFMFDMKTVILFVIYFYTWQVRIMGLAFKDAAGMWKDDFLKPYIGIICNLVLNIILVKVIGVTGILLATIFVFVFIYFPWENYVLFKKLFETKMILFLIKQSFYLFISVCAAFFIYFINSRIVLNNSIIHLCLRFLITIILSAGFITLFTFWTKEFKELFYRINRFIHCKKTIF